MVDLAKLQKVGDDCQASSLLSTHELGRMLCAAAAEIAELRGRASGYEVSEEMERRKLLKCSDV